MKTHFKFRAVIGALFLGLVQTGIAVAQEQPGDNQQGNGQQHRLLSSLSQQDKIKLLKARKQVLANNPDLKAEQEDLVKQRQALKGQGTNASKDDRKALRQKSIAHEKKMQNAMLQVDPSLAPVFEQIDQAMKEKRQQHQDQGIVN